MTTTEELAIAIDEYNAVVEKLDHAPNSSVIPHLIRSALEKFEKLLSESNA